MKRIPSAAGIIAFAFIIFLHSCSNNTAKPVINHHQLAEQYFNENHEWYVDNIPFFECSDKQIEQVYYYRWKMYKAHIRSTGHNKYVITEFINHVAWDRDPECTINAASMHHIYEGRWLKDDRYINGYINYLYQEGGNNRRYSESVADAAYNRFLVNRDTAFLLLQLDSMLYSFNQWADNHWDSSKNLYYIPAMPDATEYTIAAMDASNGKGGFDSGDAFRPTINSYMYANAMAIAKTMALKGDKKTSDTYFEKAAALKKTIEQFLWNPKLQHFTDRYKQNNQYVHYWDFIRGRELAGMIPWYFNLPADTKEFNAAWKHVTDTNNLLGQYGLRTNEPSYEYYFKQNAWFEGTRSSQWNGPSWPYQTSQALTGMANMLNNYKEAVVITPADYIKLLRLYTQQHFLPNGKINLVENYDPNLGGPIVHCYWSNHYNHSSYNNLIITGLCGVHPAAGDTLDVNPLVDNSIDYFYLDDIRYRGHTLSVVYDKDGSKYKMGKGLHVFVDDKKAALLNKNGRNYIVLGTAVKTPVTAQAPNLALNIYRKGYPAPAASVNTVPDSSLYQAVDGRTWYFTEITNRWTTEGSTSGTDWYSVDFGTAKNISQVSIYFFADGSTFTVPDAVSLEYKNGNQWLPLKINMQQPATITGNTGNTFVTEKITATQVRIHFKHSKQVAVSELEIY